MNQNRDHALLKDNSNICKQHHEIRTTPGMLRLLIYTSYITDRVLIRILKCADLRRHSKYLERIAQPPTEERKLCLLHKDECIAKSSCVRSCQRISPKLSSFEVQDMFELF